MIAQAPVWEGSKGRGEGVVGRKGRRDGLMELPRRCEPFGGVVPSPSAASRTSIRSCNAAREVCMDSMARSSGVRWIGVAWVIEGGPAELEPGR